jgi:hypothetical protein
MPEKLRVCIDCVAEGVSSTRPAPYRGPRCATHDRIERRRLKDAAHERHVVNTYGLGPGEYKALYDGQGGRCAICARATGRTKRLANDHDHACCAGPQSCGLCVRGLLCGPCNDLVGRYSIEQLQRAIGYLADPPAPYILAAHRATPREYHESR